MIENNNKGRL